MGSRRPGNTVAAEGLRWVLLMLLFTSACAGAVPADPAARAVPGGGDVPAHTPPESARADPFRPGVCPPFPLRNEAGEIINPLDGRNAGQPYSPRQTCGACHDYEKITRGYHFTQGKGEAPTPAQAARCAWVTSPGNYGGTW